MPIIIVSTIVQKTVNLFIVIFSGSNLIYKKCRDLKGETKEGLGITTKTNKRYRGSYREEKEPLHATKLIVNRNAKQNREKIRLIKLMKKIIRY